MLVNLPLPYELKKKSNFDEHKPEISLLKKGNFIKQHNFPQMLPASWNRIYIGGRQAGRGCSYSIAGPSLDGRHYRHVPTFKFGNPREFQLKFAEKKLNVFHNHKKTETQVSVLICSFFLTL